MTFCVLCFVSFCIVLYIVLLCFVVFCCVVSFSALFCFILLSSFCPYENRLTEEGKNKSKSKMSVKNGQSVIPVQLAVKCGVDRQKPETWKNRSRMFPNTGRYIVRYVDRLTVVVAVNVEICISYTIVPVL